MAYALSIAVFLLLLSSSSCQPVYLSSLENKIDYKLDIDFASDLHEAAFEGDVKGVQRSLKYNADKINLQDKQGNTALHLAVQAKQAVVVSLLLSHAADPTIKNKSGDLPLHLAASNGACEIIETLVQQHKQLVNYGNALGQTPAHLATLYKQTDALKKLISYQADLSVVDNEGYPVSYTLLKSYTQAEDKAFVEQLFQEYPLSRYRSTTGSSLLHIAAQQGDVAVANHLLTLDRSLVGIVDASGRTFLDSACAQGQVAFLQHYTEALEDIDIHHINAQGMTKLHEAALSGKVPMVEFLIEHGLAVDAKDNAGKTVLHYACLSGNLAVIEGLYPYIKFDINAQDNQKQTALHIACQKGAYAIVTYLLERQASPNITNGEGRNSLHLAAIQGHEKVVDILLRYDAKPQVKDIYHHTVLYYALKHKHQPCIDLLKRKGAAVSDDESEQEEKECIEKGLENEHIAFDQATIKLIFDPRTLDKIYAKIHHAAEIGDLTTLKRLLKLGANLDRADEEGNTPLHIAAFNGQLAIVEYLLNKGANPNIANDNGCTPLHGAASGGHVTVVALLLIKDANPKIANGNGYTPLHDAAYNGHVAIAQLLLKHGVNPNASNNNGYTPLHIAAYSGHVAIVDLLLKEDANPTIDSKCFFRGYTPLHMAARYGRLSVVELLLTKGVEPNITNKDGDTPLHDAARDGKVSVVALLLEKGANPNIKTKKGNTPLHEAMVNGHTQIIELLEKVSADRQLNKD